MAEFKKAFAITSDWEGKWDRQSEAFIIDDNRASYGITPLFLKDFVGYGTKQKPLSKEVMKAIQFNQAAVIWEASRWTWMQGNYIQHQEIANLVFDWSVRRWNSMINGLRKVLVNMGPATNANGSTLIGDGDKWSKRVLMRSMGGNPDVSTNGFFLPTSELIEELNRQSLLPNAALLHQRLKDKRYELDIDKKTAASVKNRYNSFCFQGTPTKTQWEKGIRCQPLAKYNIQGSTPENTEGGTNLGKMLLTGAAIYFGGKFAKFW